MVRVSFRIFKTWRCHQDLDSFSKMFLGSLGFAQQRKLTMSNYN